MVQEKSIEIELSTYCRNIKTNPLGAASHHLICEGTFWYLYMFL